MSFQQKTSASESSPDCSKHVGGAAAVDITPRFPVFLYGYPHVTRMSTDVNDPLLATALYLGDGQTQVLLVSVDIIWISKQQVARARQRITDETGIAAEHILISATHTHSGPSTVEILSNGHDRVIPPSDSRVIAKVEGGIVAAATQAIRSAVPVEFGFAKTDVPGIGGNRHDPVGRSLSEVPIIAIRSANREKQLLAVHYVFSVHPTVLHEDSTLISGDFPGLARRHLQRNLRGENHSLPVLHHLGAAGDQSPRNVVRANTLEEADRLGGVLASAIYDALSRVEFSSNWSLECATTSVLLPLRELPTPDDAAAVLAELRTRFTKLKSEGASRSTLRTAECDYFGAEEVNALVAAYAEGTFQQAAEKCLPAEIQLIRIGSRWLVGWPGEIFVEFALRIQERFPHVTIITLANGELQGYLTTTEAVENRWYEASNAIFHSPVSGEILVDATIRLLRHRYPT